MVAVVVILSSVLFAVGSVALAHMWSASGEAERTTVLDVGGDGVTYDRTIVRTTESGARRTTYFLGDVLVAAAWDRDGTGLDDLWLRVDAEWFVDRQAIDDDGDGVADRVWRVERDGTVVALDVRRVGGTGSAGWLVGVGVLVGVLAVGGALVAQRRRRTNAPPGVAGPAGALGITIALVVPMVALGPAPQVEAVPGMSSARALYDDECELDEERFAREWERYSDLDERIPLRSRSVEAQEVAASIATLQRLLGDHYELQAILEVEREELDALREYRHALVNDLRRNLVRSFIRLTMLTATHIKSAVDLRGSVQNLLFGDTVAQVFGAVLAVGRAYRPAVDERVSEARLAAEDVAWTGVTSFLEQLGDPGKVASAVAATAVQQGWRAVPEMDLTDEEVAILRDQHLRREDLDATMLEYERRLAEGREQLAEYEAGMDALVERLDTARAAERDRVRDAVLAECRRLRDRDADADADADAVTGDDAPIVGDDDAGPVTSVPGDRTPLVGTWVAEDGSFGYEFGADGSWRSVDASGEQTGRFDVVTDGTVATITFRAADGDQLRHLLSASYRVQGDSLVFTIAGREVRLRRGPLPDLESVGATFDVDSPAVPVRVNGDLRYRFTAASSPVDGWRPGRSLRPFDVVGTVTVGRDGTASGSLTVGYECIQCTSPGEAASAQSTVALRPGTPTEPQGTTSVWRVEGVADIRVRLDGVEIVAGQSRPWTYQWSGAVDYWVERSSGVWGVIEFGSPPNPDFESFVIGFQVISPV